MFGTASVRPEFGAVMEPLRCEWLDARDTIDLRDNNRRNSFLYGGSGDVEQSSADVYVLSIPAFRWLRISAPGGTQRAAHQCAVAGQRQMIVVGGFKVSPSTNDDWASTDVWSQGLGVFDLTAMQWMDHFDPDADAYDSPSPIKDWYTGGYDFSRL